MRSFRDNGTRVSVFVDPVPAAIAWAKELGADRVELYTEPYARAFEIGGDVLVESKRAYREAIAAARAAGLGVNAGHDLNLENLRPFLQLGQVDEVSIGHALISRALFVGLQQTVREYLAITSA